MSTPVPRWYDLVVVGAGSGGYVAGIRAAQLGMTVAIIEERYWGGVCLNTGCVPSKALLRNAEIASILTHQADEFGIGGDIHLDYARAVSRSREVAEARVRGVHFLMRKNKITQIDGRGRFSGSHTLEVQLPDGGTTSLRFDNAIIATGSRVRMLPGVTLSDNIVTYEQQILDAAIPESIIIIGAGGIGMEFAYVLNSYGVDVQILEYADRALPNEDADVSKELTRQYRRRGIPIQTNTRVDSVMSTTAAPPQSTPPVRSSVSDFAPTSKTLASISSACTSQQVGQSTSTTTCAPRLPTSSRSATSPPKSNSPMSLQPKESSPPKPSPAPRPCPWTTA